MCRRIAIVGGGISGLAAANRLLDLDPAADVMVLESSDRLGGVLRTTRRDGFLMEGAADEFLTTMPWGVDFSRRVGCDLVPTTAVAGGQRAFVVHKGRLQPIPPGFLALAPSRLGPILTSPVLSMRGKLRMGLECRVAQPLPLGPLP